jgi:hypothetical protein
MCYCSAWNVSNLLPLLQDATISGACNSLVNELGKMFRIKCIVKTKRDASGCEKNILIF